jgi:hypothetical protein
LVLIMLSPTFRIMASEAAGREAPGAWRVAIPSGTRAAPRSSPEAAVDQRVYPPLPLRSDRSDAFSCSTVDAARLPLG